MRGLTAVQLVILRGRTRDKNVRADEFEALNPLLAEAGIQHRVWFSTGSLEAVWRWIGSAKPM
jgi:hypothetical protein